MSLTTFEAAFRAIDTGQTTRRGINETVLPLARIEYSHHGQGESDRAPRAGILVEWRGDPYYFWSNDLHGDYLTRTLHAVDAGGNVHRSWTAPDRTMGLATPAGTGNPPAIGGDPVAWVDLARLD